MTFPDPPPWEQQPRTEDPVGLGPSKRRIAYAAAAVVVVGVLVLALGVVLPSWWVSAAGLVVAVVAAVVAWRVGVLRDVRR